MTCGLIKAMVHLSGESTEVTGKAERFMQRNNRNDSIMVLQNFHQLFM
jgi:hypothetical protein